MGRNLNIDKSKQAKIVVDTVEQYNALPHNQVDLEGYDTRYSKKEAKRLIAKTKYSKSDKKLFRKAQAINKKRSINSLHRDLRTTKNVVPLSELNKWKADPNKFDIKGIDTRPKGMTGFVTNSVRKDHTNINRPKKSNIGINTLGTYSPLKNKIRLNQAWKHKEDRYHRAYAHELGHGIDRNTHGFKLKFSSNERKGLKKGAFRINPVSKDAGRNFLKYRNDKKELVADYFSDIVEDPRRAKKENPKLFNKILPNKNIERTIKKSESKFLNKYIKKLRF